MTEVVVEEAVQAITKLLCLRSVHEEYINRMSRRQGRAGEGISPSWHELSKRGLRSWNDMKVGGSNKRSTNLIGHQVSATKSIVDEGMRMLRCTTHTSRRSVRVGQSIIAILPFGEVT